MHYCPDCDDRLPAHCEHGDRCLNCTEEHELSRRLEAERRNYEHFFTTGEDLPLLGHDLGSEVKP